MNLEPVKALEWIKLEKKSIAGKSNTELNLTWPPIATGDVPAAARVGGHRPDRTVATPTDATDAAADTAADAANDAEPAAGAAESPADAGPAQPCQTHFPVQVPNLIRYPVIFKRNFFLMHPSSNE